MRTLRFLSLCISFLLPAAGAAYTYDTANLPYSDPPTGKEAAVAVSLLTELGIVEGNPDGTFRPAARLNRAEFVKIAMGLVDNPPDVELTRCFPDVFVTEWYFRPVCQAKQLGLVSGNANANLPREQWVFVPARNVQYVEALKILSILFEAPVLTAQTGEQWYKPYVDSARSLGVALPSNPEPGHMLTRGEMSRLVARYLAYAAGEFDAYLEATGSTAATVSSSSVSSQASSSASSQPASTSSADSSTDSSSVSSSSSEEESGFVPTEFDTNVSTDIRNNLLILGEESPILGAVRVVSTMQPVRLDKLIVRLKTSTTSVESINIYRSSDAAFLGTAYLDATYPGARQYVLNMKSADLVIDRNEEFRFYARANVSDADTAGTSGVIVEIDKMGFEATGVWNSDTQTAFNTTENNIVLQTAAAALLNIENAGPQKSALIAGSQLRLGSFRFSGRKSIGAGPSLEMRLTQLNLTVAIDGGIVLSNVYVKAGSSGEAVPCSYSSYQITCSSIPEDVGSFEGVDRVLTFYGDIAIPSNAIDPYVQLIINEPGNPMSAGSVRWTDGFANFHWVPISNYPIAQSTRYD